MPVRFRLAELLAARDMTPYALHRAAPDVISQSAAYRFARGQFKCVHMEVLDAICDALGCHPSELFDRDEPRAKAVKRPTKSASAKRKPSHR